MGAQGYYLNKVGAEREMTTVSETSKDTCTALCECKWVKDRVLNLKITDKVSIISHMPQWEVSFAFQCVLKAKTDVVINLI